MKNCRVSGPEQSADAIARALGGRRSGSGWMARCPAHGDRTRSRSLTNSQDGKVLVGCHAGCEQERVIAALRGRGLWGEGRSRSSAWPRRRKPVDREPDGDNAKRTKRALAVWQSSKPSPATPVAAYLASRRLHLPPSDRLRFHADMKHRSGGFWPAMLPRTRDCGWAEGSRAYVLVFAKSTTVHAVQ